MKTISFNINDYVLVKLTDIGRRYLRDNHDNFMVRIGKSLFDYVPPKEDNEGWSRWQMWSLMQELGKHQRMGFEPPFELEIKIEVNT
jgi:hypothetical protein